jgi:hypothetical protein
MARLALGYQMPTRKRKARQAVIKTGFFPNLVVVAGLALGAQLPFVLIVFSMATQAIQGGVAEAGQVFVASRALQLGLGMGIFERELGALMLEKALGCFPVAFVVAITTQGSQILLVLIVFGVAAVAIFGRLFVHRALMALLALHLRMFA